MSSAKLFLDKILLVDDELVMRELMSNFSAALGFAYEVAADGEEAVARLQKGDFNLVVTDLNMPNMDGLQLLEYTRIKHPEVGVIVATGFAHDYKYIDLINAGAIDYMVKPFLQREFSAKINRAFREINMIRLLKKENAERKKTEEALWRAHDELEHRIEARTNALKKTYEQLLHAEKLSAIGSLSAAIAYEFNNPLQGVMTVLNSVKKWSSLNENDHSLVSMALDECNRMKSLVCGLQGFNRLTPGRTAPMDIHNMIDTLLLLGAKDYQGRGITLKTNFSENIPLLHVAVDQMKQVFVNLFKSAVLSCDSNGTIQVNTEVENDAVTVRIQNSSKACGADDVANIFDACFPAASGVDGRNLGLYVSQEIVQSHGGSIDVASEPGKGLTFSLLLPVDGCSAEPGSLL